MWSSQCFTIKDLSPISETGPLDIFVIFGDQRITFIPVVYWSMYESRRRTKREEKSWGSYDRRFWNMKCVSYLESFLSVETSFMNFYDHNSWKRGFIKVCMFKVPYREYVGNGYLHGPLYDVVLFRYLILFHPGFYVLGLLTFSSHSLV